jgi:hypothetical protein
MAGLVKTDTIQEQTTGAGVTITGLKFSDLSISSPTASDEGKIRYRKDSNNSYCDMVMQISATPTYAWVNVMTQSW